jgi:hypothetical protein
VTRDGEPDDGGGRRDQPASVGDARLEQHEREGDLQTVPQRPDALAHRVTLLDDRSAFHADYVVIGHIDALLQA